MGEDGETFDFVDDDDGKLSRQASRDVSQMQRQRPSERCTQGSRRPHSPPCPPQCAPAPPSASADRSFFRGGGVFNIARCPFPVPPTCPARLLSPGAGAKARATKHRGVLRLRQLLRNRLAIHKQPRWQLLPFQIHHSTPQRCAKSRMRPRVHVAAILADKRLLAHLVNEHPAHPKRAP